MIHFWDDWAKLFFNKSPMPSVLLRNVQIPWSPRSWKAPTSTHLFALKSWIFFRRLSSLQLSQKLNRPKSSQPKLSDVHIGHYLINNKNIYDLIYLCTVYPWFVEGPGLRFKLGMLNFNKKLHSSCCERCTLRLGTKSNSWQQVLERCFHRFSLAFDKRKKMGDRHCANAPENKKWTCWFVLNLRNCCFINICRSLSMPTAPSRIQSLLLLRIFPSRNIHRKRSTFKAASKQCAKKIQHEKTIHQKKIFKKKNKINQNMKLLRKFHQTSTKF